MPGTRHLTVDISQGLWDMKAVSSYNLGAVLAAAAFLAVLLGTAALQFAVAKGTERMPSGSSDAPSGVPAALTGESAVDPGLKTAVIEIDNGQIECKAATGGESRVSWEVIPRPGVAAEQMEVRATRDGDVLRVEDVWHGSPRGKKPEVRVTAWLPAQTDLELGLGNGKVITALSGKVKAGVGNGDLWLEGAPISLDISLGNGEVHASAKLSQGDNQVHLGHGTIELRLLEGSDTQVQVTTATGSVQTRGISGRATQHNWVGSSYSGKVGGGRASLVLEVGSGDVRLDGAGK